MNNNEKTLDLTMFNRATFGGKIRLRHLADWAYDYWVKHEKLVRVKLRDFEYHELLREIEADNVYLKARESKTLSIDLGFGEIEIVRAE